MFSSIVKCQCDRKRVKNVSICLGTINVVAVSFYLPDTNKQADALEEANRLLLLTWEPFSLLPDGSKLVCFDANLRAIRGLYMSGLFTPYQATLS